MKKKRNVVGLLGKTAVALTLISTCLVGGTLAKYTSEVTGTGTAITAKWAFKAGSSEGASTITPFTLGETTDGVVAKERIAPGSNGTIPIYYDLTGTEVETQLKISIKVNDKSKLPTNFKMSLGGTVKTQADFTNDTYIEFYKTTLGVDSSTHVVLASSAKGNATINWEWPYESGTSDAEKATEDSVDTVYGEGAETAIFTVKVEAVQLTN